jgi:hypothetical protein
VLKPGGRVAIALSTIKVRSLTINCYHEPTTPSPTTHDLGRLAAAVAIDRESPYSVCELTHPPNYLPTYLPTNLPTYLLLRPPRCSRVSSGRCACVCLSDYTSCSRWSSRRVWLVISKVVSGGVSGQRVSIGSESVTRSRKGMSGGVTRERVSIGSE